MEFLRQNTATTVKLGPFVDDTDQKTRETLLTILAANVLLSKNGSTLAAKSNTSTSVHDSLGVYFVNLNAADTNVAGRLQIVPDVAGTMPFLKEVTVLPAEVYDRWFGILPVAPTVLHTTTISTVRTQLDMDIASGSDDGGAYKDRLAVFIDQVSNSQKGFAFINSYSVGASKTIILKSAPQFDVSVDDRIEILTLPDNPLVQVAPLQAGVITPNLTTFGVTKLNLRVFQHQAGSFVFPVKDGNGDPINLAGKTVRFVVHDRDETEKFSVAGSVGGVNSNEVTIAPTTLNNGTAADWLYKLWNITDSAVYASGSYTIETASLGTP